MPAEAEIADPDTNKTPGLNSMREKFDSLMGEVRATQQGTPPADEPPAKPIAAKPDANPIPKPLAQPPAQAVKPPEKPADTPKPDDDDVPASIKSPKAADEWRALKKTRDEFKTKSEQFEARTRELEGKLATVPKIDTGELETLRKQKTEAEEFLKNFAIEHDPRFQEQFKGRIDGAINRIKTIVGGKEGETLADLMRLSESQYRTEQIQAIAETLPTITQSRIGSLMEEIERAGTERESIIKKTRDNFGEMQKQTIAQQQAQQETAQKDHDAIFSGVLSTLKNDKDGIPIFQTREGDTEWNGQVNERIASMKAIFDGKYSPTDQARWAAWAVQAPALLATCDAQRAEIEKLTTQLKEFQGATPTLEGGQGEQRTAAPQGQELEGSFLRKYNALKPPTAQ